MKKVIFGFTALTVLSVSAMADWIDTNVAAQICQPNNLQLDVKFGGLQGLTLQLSSASSKLSLSDSWQSMCIKASTGALSGRKLFQTAMALPGVFPQRFAQVDYFVAGASLILHNNDGYIFKDEGSFGAPGSVMYMPSNLYDAALFFRNSMTALLIIKQQTGDATALIKYFEYINSGGNLNILLNSDKKKDLYGKAMIKLNTLESYVDSGMVKQGMTVNQAITLVNEGGW